MSFWCHRFEQNTNEHFLRITALKRGKIKKVTNQIIFNYTVPLGDWLEKKKVPGIIIKQQFEFPIRTT